MKITKLTFITGNQAKAEQLSRHFNFPVDHKKIDLPEIQSLDLKEIIEHKARAAYDVVGLPVLVEDASLIFHALGRLPGPLIKWFLSELDNNGLCKLLKNYRNRSATAQVVFGLFDGRKLSMYEGKISGRIALKPRGKRGFGWDPIFIPRGSTKTWGEMDVHEQKTTSMRRVALTKLTRDLKSS